MSRVAEYRKTAQQKTEEVQALFRKIDTEQAGVETAEQHDQIKGLNKEAEELLVQAQKAEEWDNERTTAQKRQEFLGQVDRKYPVHGTAPESRGDRLAQSLKSFGEQFIADPEFLDWLKHVSPNGEVAKKIKLQSPPVNLPGGLKALRRGADMSGVEEALKALVTGAGSTSGGPFVNIDYRGLLDRGTFERPLKILDLITQLETTSDTVEYIRLGAHTNAAAPVAEATATGGSSGTKPESTLVTAAVTDTVKTIAHWIPATRRALQDAPQLRGLIDSFLRYGLAEEVEDQVIAGSGVGENFTGVLNTPNIQTMAYTTSLLVTTRKAVTKALLTGRVQPSAWVFHPSDWETMDLLIDNEQRYYFGGPMVLGTPKLWGYPVVQSEAVTVGHAILGDWRYAVLWDRMQTAIYMSDSHSDFFIRNLLAILAELRAGFGVIRPAAFVDTDLTP